MFGGNVRLGSRSGWVRGHLNVIYTLRMDSADSWALVLAWSLQAVSQHFSMQSTQALHWAILKGATNDLQDSCTGEQLALPKIPGELTDPVTTWILMKFINSNSGQRFHVVRLWNPICTILQAQVILIFRLSKPRTPNQFPKASPVVHGSSTTCSVLTVKYFWLLGCWN